MAHVRRVTEADFDAVYELLRARVGERNEYAVRAWFDRYPELFQMAVEDGDVVGFALGRPRGAETVELVGIAVVAERTREGVGSRLLDAFEAGAAELGYGRVSVGSAGGYVDEFYLANGYEPESILVRTTRNALPADYRERFDVLRERAENGTWKVYLAPGGSERDPLDHQRVERVREAFDDPEAIYLLEKRR